MAISVAAAANAGGFYIRGIVSNTLDGDNRHVVWNASGNVATTADRDAGWDLNGIIGYKFDNILAGGSLAIETNVLSWNLNGNHSAALLPPTGFVAYYMPKVKGRLVPYAGFGLANLMYDYGDTSSWGINTNWIAGLAYNVNSKIALSAQYDYGYGRHASWNDNIGWADSNHSHVVSAGVSYAF